MISVGNKVVVQFDLNHNKVFNIGGGIDLIKSDIWQYESGVSDDKMEAKVNKSLTNPQIATVIASSRNYKVAKGEQVFLHFMAWEWAQDESFILDGKECHVIDGKYIMFKFNDNGVILADDTFLGTVIKDSNMTLSGIIISIEEKRRAATIVITHIPDKTKERFVEIKVGNTVKTIDDHQYVFNFKGKEYVKLESEEIMGILID